MSSLFEEIRACRICEESLPHGPNPVISGSPRSKIILVGQAPGRRVHESGIPWDDKSGELLRNWLDVSEEQFYDPDLFALVPMGFCYPGKGPSGDLPPRTECAEAWHEKVLHYLSSIQLTVLIGQYAQNQYTEDKGKVTLTERVKNFGSYLPDTIPLPHPSPRNRMWLKRNGWFEEELLPVLKQRVRSILAN